ncbi:hypothetical protein LX36DRAFT_368379 [Colletotrichum falcatum]|nr:hypothetical protein LX36DRAFT_368379 [Colletotrichum falcatum]
MSLPRKLDQMVWQHNNPSSTTLVTILIIHVSQCSHSAQKTRVDSGRRQDPQTAGSPEPRRTAVELGHFWLGLLSAARSRAVVLGPANSEVIGPPDLGATIDMQGDQDRAETSEAHSREGSERAVGRLVAGVDPGFLAGGFRLLGLVCIPSVAGEGEGTKLVGNSRVGVAAQVHAEEVKFETRRRSKLPHANLGRITRDAVLGTVRQNRRHEFEKATAR